MCKLLEEIYISKLDRLTSYMYIWNKLKENANFVKILIHKGMLNGKPL